MGYDFDPVDVPTADSTDDVMMRDVVGKKDDAALTTVGTTRSLMAYLKGVLNDLANGTDGLGALKSLMDTATTNVGTVDTVVDGIQTDLSNATDGLGALKALIDANQTDLTNIETKVDTVTTNVGTVDTVVDGIQTDLSNATDGLGALKTLIDGVETKVDTVTTNVGTVDTVVDGIKAKSDLLNSAAGTSTLNDANTSDTVVPGSLPTKIHVVFDISTIIVANDDFTLEVKVGVSGSERVVAYYKITSDGTDTTIDTGSGTGAKVKARRIDISDIMVYTGERVLLNYTKNSATDRDVLYRYVCGV